MSDEREATAPEEEAMPGRAQRMAEAVRLVVTSRERAPRPPRLAHAFKRLIWRYSRECGRETAEEESTDATR